MHTAFEAIPKKKNKKKQKKTREAACNTYIAAALPSSAGEMRGISHPSGRTHGKKCSFNYWYAVPRLARVAKKRF